MMKTFIISVLLLSCSILSAQINFQFVPEIYGRNVDGLLSVRILNTGNSIAYGNLTIKVKAGGYGEIVSIITAPISFNPGVNVLSPTAISKAGISFSENSLGRVVRQSGIFPEAAYEYCFSVEDGKDGGGLLGNDCFTYELEPLSPLSLIEPYNTQTICEYIPTLVWQPVVPALTGLLYQVTLAEVKKGQSPTEALFYNVPIVNTKNLFSSYLPYPSIAPSLDTGKTYVWQVTSYKGDLVISRSEIWTFKVGCEDPVVKEVPDGYRNIEDLVRGNYYVAEGRILFAIDNPYVSMDLKYSITCLTDPEIKIKRVPKVELKKGRNNVLIELDNARQYKDGYSYIMNFQLPNGIQQSLRFVYKQK